MSKLKVIILGLVVIAVLGGCGSSSSSSTSFSSVSSVSSSSSSSSSTTSSSSTLSAGAYGDLTVDGTVVTLGSGQYVFNNISLTNGANLVTNGPVQIYVLGNATVQNSTITQSGGAPSAQNLMLIGNNATTWTFDNAGTIYGGMYMPQSNVVFSNGTILRGSLVANTFNSHNSQIVYDSSLSTYSLDGMGMASMMSVERFDTRP